uniref:Uncharacterized protein n=1 Tax=Caenorhabditis japonica TaxID=281687 RepID=A0A8R1E0K2_CAEJA
MLEWLAPDYQYSTHRHSIVTTELGLEHHYTVISFNQRLSEQKIAELIDKIEKPEPPKALDKRSRSPDRHPANRSGHMVSQISSTTTSEKRMCPMTAAMDLSVGKTPATTSSSSYASSSSSLSNTSNGTSRETGPISPISSPTASEREQRSTAPPKPMFTTASMVSKSHLPEYTYLSPGLTKSRSSKCVMMVQTFPGSSLLRSNSTRPHPPLLSTITHDTTPPSNSAVTFSQDGFQPPPTIMPFTALLLLR